MRQTRGLWASIALVAVLIVASATGFLTGYLKPKLGLDLEGGISVILQAPQNTDKSVMEQATENIRNRVDAFGVGEPLIAVSSNTITVEIPGGANGTIQQNQKLQYCLVTANGTNYGCAPDQATAERALKDLLVTPQPSHFCVNDNAGAQLSCLDTKAAAVAFKTALTVAKKATTPPSPSASPTPTTSATASPGSTPSASPSSGPPPSLKGTYCLADTAGADVACYPDKAAATAAQKGAVIKGVQATYCVTDSGGSSASGSTGSGSPTPSATPSVSPSPSTSAKRSPTPSASASASPSPSPKPSAFSQLSFDGAEPNLPCGLTSRGDATAQLAAIKATQETTQYCVISSAQESLGCYITRSAAEARQRSTGEDRLIAVIGKTARLEQRPVLGVLSASDPTPVTCVSPADQDTPKCSFDTLKNQDVVYLDKTGTQKLKLGPVVLSGDQITKASATLDTQGVSAWTVNFTLNGAGKASFAAATTTAVGAPAPQNQIAIVIDRQVISAPTVTSAITAGSGQITGGFSEQEAKDLATQLNAGALPVDLSVQSVQTISPTLGSQSLHQGIVAGVVGLVLLFMYLLFYYRLLGVVAWVGMSIWAVLALALISFAGRTLSYSMTLAGVAGLVISLGVTADSYIVFFERLKDEVRGGKTPRSAVQPAFKRAFRTIVAADIVTGLAAAVLWLTAVSSVRGFALTLGVATLLDLFVVYFFKRPTVFLIARNERLVTLRGFGLTSGVAGEPEPGTGHGVGVPTGGRG